MSNIDWGGVETAAQRADAAAAESALALKLECRRRIYEIVDEIAQANLSALAAAGVMPEADLTTYRTGLQWIAAMRAACATAIADRTDPVWPGVPAGVAELAERF